jgi:hypothetical protein
MVSNYFKVPGHDLGVDGVFPFIDGDEFSTRRAFEAAAQLDDDLRTEGGPRVCVWRTPKAKGSWARVPVIGEARPGAVWL